MFCKAFRGRGGPVFHEMDTKKVLAILIGLLMLISPMAFILGQALT